MNAAAEKIAFLRASLARVDGLESHARVPLGHPTADACLRGGIQKGALHEIYPAAAGDEAAASGFAVALAVRVAAKKRVLWLRPDFAALEGGELSPLGLLELGIDPTRMLLLRAADAASTLRAALDALSCKALGAIVIEIPGAPKILDLAASRRLVLATAQTGVTAFLLRMMAEPEASAAETRWLIRAARSYPPSGALARATSPASGGGKEEDWGSPLFETDLVRNRHGRMGHWVMKWSCDNGFFREADPGAVVSAPSDRPAAAAMERAGRAGMPRVA
jgi:protein ImuA